MSTQYIFDASGFLTGVAEGVATQENSTTIPPIYTEGFTPQFVNGSWVDQSSAPKVSPVQFKLLFTPLERVAMSEAKAVDAILQDFFSVVDDPRLTFVDLGLQSTKDAVAYLVSKDFLTQERGTEVLSGVLK